VESDEGGRPRLLAVERKDGSRPGTVERNDGSRPGAVERAVVEHATTVWARTVRVCCTVGPASRSTHGGAIDVTCRRVTLDKHKEVLSVYVTIRMCPRAEQVGAACRTLHFAVSAWVLQATAPGQGEERIVDDAVSSIPGLRSAVAA
jgi:hypothetical protein